MTSNKTKSAKEKTVAKKKSSAPKDSLEPVVVQGSHLTVTTWPNGRTELKWDDEALLRDVQMAITKFESMVPAKQTRAPKKAKK